jgi:deoxycytidine triphosphate deaminase
MASIISGEKLKKLIEEHNLIEYANLSNCEGLKYDFTLSNEFLKAKCNTPQNYDRLSISERREYALIVPGEVVYFHSREIVHMPNNIYAQLTPKRKMGELGINVNCALFIDPEYEGVLIFGFYNYSSENFSFSPGMTFASAVFYMLEDDELFDYSVGGKPEKIFGFKPNLIAAISKYEPIGYIELSRSVEKMKGEITGIKEELNDNRRWARDVKEMIDGLSLENIKTSKNIESINENILNLSNTLKNEMNIREKYDNDLDHKIAIETIDRKNSTKFIGSLVGFGLFVLGCAVTLLISWLTGFIK